MLGDDNSVLESDGPLIWALDDESMTLAMFEDVLTQGGYRFEGFVEERAMLERVEGHEPELLLLDWMLPGSSGHDVLRRWMTHRPHIPVIVVTALSGESVLLNAFEVGACDVVRKPFDVTELLARVHRQLLERAQTHHEVSRRARQSRIVSFACALMRGATAQMCWDALQEVLAGETGAKLFTRQGGEFRAYGETRVLDLSASAHEWGALMRGEGVWMDAEVLARLPAIHEDEEWAYAAPLHDGRHVHGVMWWSGQRRRREIARIFEHIGDVFMTMMARLERESADHQERVREESPGLKSLTREFLDRIIEASPDAIVAADRGGEIILFNAAAERILKWDRSRALGDNVRHLYRDGVAYQIMQRLRAEEEGGWGRLSKCREVLLAHDRDEIPVELSAALIVREGEVLGTVGLFRDIRERIAMEGQLERATQDLEAHREQVVMAEMAGATAHELNQPLTSMLNYVEVLKEDEAVQANPRAQRAVEVIERDVIRLAEIVKHIGQITQYRTRTYVDDTRILDLGEGKE